MKQKTITPENYLQFKPSEFLRSFISDIEVAEDITKRTGKKMNMGLFIPTPNCLPGLGGMACMNMGLTYPKTEGYMDRSSLTHSVADLGDDIRLGNGLFINNTLGRIYPEFSSVYLPYMRGVSGSTPEDLQELKNRITIYADLIEASGQ